jgi:hypothetical protein
MRAAAAAVLLAFAGAASAQGIEPGEWEFTTSMSGPMFPKPQTMTIKRCVTQADAGNPERWGGGQRAQTDCKMNYTKKSSSQMAWDMACPSSNMTGRGSVRMGRGTMESEMQMRGEHKGQKIDMTTRTTGRRLGPCKG